MLRNDGTLHPGLAALLFAGLFLLGYWVFYLDGLEGGIDQVHELLVETGGTNG